MKQWHSHIITRSQTMAQLMGTQCAQRKQLGDLGAFLWSILNQEVSHYMCAVCSQRSPPVTTKFVNGDRKGAWESVSYSRCK